MSDGNGAPVVPDTRGELIGRLKSKLKEYATRNKALETERDAAVGERDAAHTLAVKAQQDYDAAPLKAKVDELNQRLRDASHKATFAKVAREKGVADDAIDLVYQHSGYRAEADDPDEAAIGALLDDLKDRPGVSRLFGEPGPAGTPGPARGQGTRDSSGGKFRVTKAQARNADWCLANRARMQAAVRDGTLEYIE